MTFPAVQTKTTTAGSLASPFNLNLPTGIAAGDILIMMMDRVGGGNQTFTWPSDWNPLFSASSGLSATARTAVAWKLATGAEGSTISVSSTVTGANNTNAICYRISGASSVEVSTGVNGNTANPDPPSLTPSWGAADTLWIALFGTQSATTTVTSYPTNYSTDQQASGGSSPLIAAATRQLNAVSENPGTFTLASSSTLVALTLAVKPTAALPAAQGSYSITGNAANLTHGSKVVAAQGSYAISGGAANFPPGHGVAATRGLYSITGNAAGSVHTYRIIPIQGSYVLTGNAAALIGTFNGLQVFAGGRWQGPISISVNVSGVWKLSLGIWIKYYGAWKQVDS